MVVGTNCIFWVMYFRKIQEYHIVIVLIIILNYRVITAWNNNIGRYTRDIF